MYLLQDQDDAAERAGPLAEIEFWRSRTVDLGGIRDQLDDTSEHPQQASACILLSTYAAASQCMHPAFHLCRSRQVPDMYTNVTVTAVAEHLIRTQP